MSDQPAPSGEIVHIAGPWFRVGTQLRQRCAWCGAILIDTDIATVAFPIEDAPPPDHPTGGVPTWSPGDLVTVDGGAQWITDPVPSEEVPGELALPPGACGRLDHEVTR